MWRWSAHVHGSLRAGLRILAPAYLSIVAYDLIRLIAVAGRWTGRNPDFLVDKVSPQLAVPSSVFGALGCALPLTGPRLATTARALRQLRQLTPLWKILEDVPTPEAIRAPLPWWGTPPAVLLTGRRTALHDAILALPCTTCSSVFGSGCTRLARRSSEPGHSVTVSRAATSPGPVGRCRSDRRSACLDFRCPPR